MRSSVVALGASVIGVSLILLGLSFGLAQGKQWQEMQERLQALEREVEQLREQLAVREQTFSVIRAEKFEVVKDGETIATLKGVELTEALGIFGKDGKLLADLSSFLGGGKLNIYNNEGKPVVVLSSFIGGGILHINNNEGKPVVGLSSFLGEGNLYINNKEGKPVRNQQQGRESRCPTSH